MLRYLTKIEPGRGSNLSLSQYRTIRFLNYLLYNGYVVNHVSCVNGLMEGTRNRKDADIIKSPSNKYGSVYTCDSFYFVDSED